MPVRIVQSKQNQRLKELRRALSTPGRSGNALVGIEGPNLIAEALRAEIHIACVFIADSSLHLLDQLQIPASLEILQMPKDLLASALATETPQPIAALVEPPDWTWAHLLGKATDRSLLIIILAALQDPGNLGTIVRSAEAFGADGIISLPGTVSEWNPKAVRASAGSVFRVPVLSVSEDDAFAQLRASGVRIIATTLHGAQSADLVNLADSAAILIGNEGNGVPANLVAHSSGAITIPCPGPVESLNAAVAASVILYESSRQRSTHSGPGQKALRGGSR
jgi:RNA methyltransferase, TrmH family